MSGLVPAVTVGAGVVALGALVALALPSRRRRRVDVDPADVPVLVARPGRAVAC